MNYYLLCIRWRNRNSKDDTYHYHNERYKGSLVDWMKNAVEGEGIEQILISATTINKADYDCLGKFMV